jgi:hypothetical protein
MLFRTAVMILSSDQNASSWRDESMFGMPNWSIRLLVSSLLEFVCGQREKFHSFLATKADAFGLGN